MYPPCWYGSKLTGKNDLSRLGDMVMGDIVEAAVPGQASSLQVPCGTLLAHSDWPGTEGRLPPFSVSRGVRPAQQCGGGRWRSLWFSYCGVLHRQLGIQRGENKHYREQSEDPKKTAVVRIRDLHGTLDPGHVSDVVPSPSTKNADWSGH